MKYKKLQVYLRFKLLFALSTTQSKWLEATFEGTYMDAKEQLASFQDYKSTVKRDWVTERQDLSTLFGNIQIKLKTYGLREWTPQSGLSISVRFVSQFSWISTFKKTVSLQDLAAAWNDLLAAEARRSRAINAQIRK